MTKAQIFEPIKMGDVRLVAGEGKLPAWAVLDACNTILRQRLAAQSAGEPPRALSLMEMGKKAFERFPDEGSEETKRAMGTARYGFMEGLRAALSVPPGDQAREEIIKAAIGVNHAVEQTGDHVQWFPALAKLRSALASEVKKP